MTAVAALAIGALFFADAVSGNVAVALLLLLLAIAVSRSLKRPLGTISRAVSLLASGDYGARVRPRPAGEAGELAEGFNLMAESVQRRMTDAAQQQSRLAAAMNSSIDAVLSLDADGRVLFANIAAEALFQKPAAEIIDHPFAWVAPDDVILTAFRVSRDLGERQISLVEWPGRQYVQVVTTPIIGGGDWSVLAVFHDLTDVRRTELIRRDFVANVSHELRTPLAAIKAVIETLADGAAEDPSVSRDFLSRADDEVDRLIELVEELLELSRIESGELPLALRPTDVPKVLEDVIRRLMPQARRKHLEVSLDIDKKMPFLHVDSVRLERAVVNLLHNAIKFTPEHGRVALSAMHDEDGLTVQVRDNGIGISAQDLPRVFERFYKVDQSRASGGSGLGLALVKHAVEAHGGRMQVESRLGQGTTFTLTIPVAAQPET
jgi:two-component system phosphate regulon sensor histidine kinase PhoR